jgi:hypothetical protein
MSGHIIRGVVPRQAEDVAALCRFPPAHLAQARLWAF